jgi:hypothetical protein
MVGDALRNGRGGPQRFVNADEIVKRHVQAHGCRVLRKPLAKAVAEPSKPLARHAQGQVRSLNMRGRNIGWKKPKAI